MQELLFFLKRRESLDYEVEMKKLGLKKESKSEKMKVNGRKEGTRRKSRIIKNSFCKAIFKIGVHGRPTGIRNLNL